MIRVGFVLGNLGDGWIGGRNYLANLLTAIRTNEGTQLQPVLIVSHETPDEAFNMFPQVEIVRSRLASRNNWLTRAGRMLERKAQRNFVLEILLRFHRIDIISHFGTLGRRSTIPSLAWIPDFQHVRMPEFFSAQAIAERDRDFTKLVRTSTQVILSSYDAQSDLERFIPGSSSNSSVLHFVSGLSELQPEGDVDNIIAQYDLPSPFFHLPNQFWAHKNHRVVIDALAILAARGIEVTVAATGHTNDQRDPLHFPALMAHAEDRGVTRNFKVLGVIPYPHLAILMQRAAAVINPSLFEGWSTTVEEAKSFGKTIILSDIPVHQEQKPDRASYFPSFDAEKLADLLERTQRTYNPTVEREKTERAQSELPARYAKFAKIYEDIVLKSIGR